MKVLEEIRMHKDDKVSIIIPVYNGEKHLVECLNTIQNQTYSNLEIICINDGSKDNSLSILKEYQNKDNRFIIIDQKNSGQSKARNEGICRASGKYISFVDCDDFIELNMIEKMVLKAESTNADIVITNFSLYFEDTGQYESYRDEVLYYTLKDKVFTINDCPEIIKYVGVWDKIFRTDFLKKNKILFWENIIYEDHLFSVQAEVYANRIALIPEHLYYYRKNAGESITDKEVENDKFKVDFLRIHKKIQEILDRNNASLKVKKNYYDFFMENAIMHQRNSTTIRFYRYFFENMRKMLDDEKIKVIKTINNKMILEYANDIYKKKLFRCMKNIH